MTQKSGSRPSVWPIGVIFGLVLLLTILAGCTFKKADFGSAENPVKLFFTPSVDTKVTDASSKEIEEFLETNTPYKFDIRIPQSYIAVVEAFGSKQADVAVLNTFGYFLANEKYGVEARLTVLRFGQSTYRAQFLVRDDDKIKDIKDLEGKKVAFVDPASASGYLLPMKLLKDMGIKLGETIFAMKHDNVVAMIYQGQVDAGATFYSPPEDGQIQDARRLVKTQFPDVEKKIKILRLTEDIPNDPIAFRKDMPEEMKVSIVEAFLKFVATKEGKESFKKLYSVTDLQRATDKDYDKVREMLKALGQSASGLLVEKTKKK